MLAAASPSGPSWDLDLDKTPSCDAKRSSSPCNSPQRTVSSIGQYLYFHSPLVGGGQGNICGRPRKLISGSFPERKQHVRYSDHFKRNPENRASERCQARLSRQRARQQGRQQTFLGCTEAEIACLLAKWSPARAGFCFQEVFMSIQTPSRVRDWLVPPIIVPLFLGLVILGSVIWRW